MPRMRGIKGQRIFICEKSGIAFRQPDMIREDGFKVGKKFAKLEPTHGDHMVSTNFSAKAEKTPPDVPKKGVVHH